MGSVDGRRGPEAKPEREGGEQGDSGMAPHAAQGQQQGQPRSQTTRPVPEIAQLVQPDRQYLSPLPQRGSQLSCSRRRAPVRLVSDVT